MRDVIADRWCYIGASTGTRRPRPRRLPPTLCTRNHIPATSCSKTPRGLLAPLGVPGLFVQVMWVHRAVGGDSGEVIGPFMHVGTYPTRHLAHICYFSDLDKKKRGGLALRQPPCIATGVGLYLNRALRDFRRRVSEDSRYRGFTFRFICQAIVAILVNPSLSKCCLLAMVSMMSRKISKSLRFLLCS